MEPHYAYFIRVSKQNLCARVLLNGWPAFRHERTIGVVDTYRINGFLLEDELNRIQVKLARFSEKKQDPEYEPQFEFELLKAPLDGKLNDPGSQVLYFRYRPDLLPLGKKLSTVFEHWFSIRDGFGRWAFQDARIYTTSDRERIVDVVRDLYGAFERRDLTAILGFFRHRLEEHARAENTDLDEVIAY